MFAIVHQYIPATRYNHDNILNMLGGLPTIVVLKYVGLDTKLIWIANIVVAYPFNEFLNLNLTQLQICPNIHSTSNS